MNSGLQKEWSNALPRQPPDPTRLTWTRWGRWRARTRCRWPWIWTCSRWTRSEPSWPWCRAGCPTGERETQLKKKMGFIIVVFIFLVPGSGCSTAVEHTPWEQQLKRLRVRIPLGPGLFYSSSFLSFPLSLHNKLVECPKQVLQGGASTEFKDK